MLLSVILKRIGDRGREEYKEELMSYYMACSELEISRKEFWYNFVTVINMQQNSLTMGFWKLFIFKLLL